MQVSAERSIDDTISTIYRCAHGLTEWPLALERISAHFNGAGAILLSRKPDGTMGTIVSPSLEKANEYYHREWWKHDIRAERYWKHFLSSREVHVDTDVVSEDELQNHPFYRDFLIPHGLGWVAGITLAPTANTLAALTLQRSFTKGPFTPAEFPAIETLARHVELSLKLSMQFAELQAKEELLSASLSKLEIGAILFDGSANVTFVNDAAKSLLLRVALSPILERVSDVAARERRVQQGRAPAVETMLVPVEGRPLLAYLVPVGALDPIREMFADSRLAVLIQSPSQAGQDIRLLTSLYQLTTSEARLAVLIGTGVSVKGAAASLGITEGTARIVLKRVFGKTGMRRQSALAALITGLGFTGRIEDG